MHNATSGSFLYFLPISYILYSCAYLDSFYKLCHQLAYYIIMVYITRFTARIPILLNIYMCSLNFIAFCSEESNSEAIITVVSPYTKLIDPYDTKPTYNLGLTLIFLI